MVGRVFSGSGLAAAALALIGGGARASTPRVDLLRKTADAEFEVQISAEPIHRATIDEFESECRQRTPPELVGRCPPRGPAGPEDGQVDLNGVTGRVESASFSSYASRPSESAREPRAVRRTKMGEASPLDDRPPAIDGRRACSGHECGRGATAVDDTRTR